MLKTSTERWVTQPNNVQFNSHTKPNALALGFGKSRNMNKNKQSVARDWVTDTKLRLLVPVDLPRQMLKRRTCKSWDDISAGVLRH